MKSPYPFPGGKSAVASLIWERLGNVSCYCEPFLGSMATLLARPEEHKPYGIEIANDLNAYISNYWRATQGNPDEVARYADAPIFEADMHAKHLWLIYQGLPDAEFRKRMLSDPDYYDCKIAGWWLWGQGIWIGSSWCDVNSAEYRMNKRPSIQESLVVTSQQRPHLTHNSGVIRLSPKPAPEVLNRGFLIGELKHPVPSLTSQTGAIHEGVYETMNALCERIKHVKLLCGGWKRCVSPGILNAYTDGNQVAGVLIDPPYSHELRDNHLYAQESATVAAEAASWAREHEHDRNLRIVFCGYSDETMSEHEFPGWDTVKWKATGGYGNQKKKGKNENRFKETLWFSPNCLKPAQMELW